MAELFVRKYSGDLDGNFESFFRSPFVILNWRSRYVYSSSLIERGEMKLNLFLFFSSRISISIYISGLSLKYLRISSTIYGSLMGHKAIFPAVWYSGSSSRITCSSKLDPFFVSCRFSMMFLILLSFPKMLALVLKSSSSSLTIFYFFSGKMQNLKLAYIGFD